jgi:hypothetical protein
MKRIIFSKAPIDNEQGFVLVVALLFLVILTLIGISATNTSIVEVQVAGNNRLMKAAFAEADGGTQTGSALLEENISCPVGFSGPAPLQIGGAGITTLNFWINEDVPLVAYPSDATRHVVLPNNNAVPHTNLYFSGNSSLSTGNAIQMIAGYEGIGYSAAAGGGQLVTNVDSQHIGPVNSLGAVRINWRHIIGREGTCLY